MVAQTTTEAKLFLPIKVGDLTLHHRIVHAPLTRLRADSQHVHTHLGVEYYAQRASTSGTLIIGEASILSAKVGGYPIIPFMETHKQLSAWKKITDAVHEKSSFIFAQIVACGRTGDPDVLQAEGGFELTGPSDIPIKGRPNPRPLTVSEIKEFVQLFATVAANAMNVAGFDGVELHSANGYLLDQFLQDVSNNRTDEYGGSIENRVRFLLEVVDAVVKAIGPTKVGVRLSPWSDYNEMGMRDPIPTFSYLVSRLTELHPTLAYIHVIEPRVSGLGDRNVRVGESNDFIRNIWSPRPLISAGGYTRELAIAAADKAGDLIAFGRHFIANPDLPRRLIADVPLNRYDRSTFYAPGDPKGYIDYPFSDELKGKDVGL